MAQFHSLTSVSGAMTDEIPIRRALLSVFDKTNLLSIATVLHSFGVELLSTGGTAKALREAGLPVKDVSEYTQSPEILDGRVKTLHPRVHGGLLYVRGNEKHETEASENGVQAIDLVVINLYPFSQVVAQGSDFDTTVENVDIGGPSMLRSAAKNHKYVSVLSSPSQYSAFAQELQFKGGVVSLATRKRLAAQAFALTAQYDAAIAAHFESSLCEGERESESVGDLVTRSYQRALPLKYGCNPHQKPAAIYRPLGRALPFAVLNGVPGYINLLDALNAWQLVAELSAALSLPAAASFKHCSPAGAAVGLPLSPVEAAAFEVSAESAASLSPAGLAYVRARNADPMCSFGDFAAVSHIVDESTARLFKTEVCDGLIAPGYEPAALEILKAKKKGAFVVLQADPAATQKMLSGISTEFREIFGVAFCQRRNDTVFTASEHLQKIVTRNGGLSEAAQRDLVLASIAVKYTQSNSVGYAKGGMMIGVGAGQQSRVDCVKLAGRKAATWYLRQHPKVLGLPFKSTVKRQDRVNARVRFIEGDFTAAEYPRWLDNFESEPAPLTESEKNEFLGTLDGVALSSDAFFPFRDSIDHASKYGVKYIAQPGGSIADDEVITACDEYDIAMAFTNLRLFHH